MYRAALAAAVVLLAANGLLHGVWTHRWQGWSDARIQAAVGRLAAVPMTAGEWHGEPVANDTLDLPEEVVGRGVTVRYTHRTEKTAVLVYLACGPTDSVVAHTPTVCYPANGFACPAADGRAGLPLPGRPPAEFKVSAFSKTEGAVTAHLRVFWAWSDGTGWRTPDNPGRAFRANPVVYKCYAIRQPLTPDEPIDGDPCLALLGELLPAVDAAVTGN